MTARATPPISSGRFNDLLKSAEDRAIPLEVSIELTHRCNFVCPHCYIPDHAVPDDLTTERVLEVIDELAALGTLFLSLTGGELLLRRDWLEIARYARRRGFSLRLFTNGALVTEAAADAMAALPTGVEISLYSLDEAVFDEVTGRRGSFARTLRGIELLRERGVPLMLKMPIMACNAGCYEQVAAYAEEIGAELVADPRIVHQKNGHLGPTALRAEPEQLLPVLQSPRSPFKAPAERPRPPAADQPLCSAGTRVALITAQGDVLGCTILPGSAGNVRERSFTDIWRESRWLKQLRTVRFGDLPECRTCDKAAYCRRCHAQAVVESGDLYAASSWSCEHAALVERAFTERG